MFDTILAKFRQKIDKTKSIHFLARYTIYRHFNSLTGKIDCVMLDIFIIFDTL
jgi:hypothetical protein